MLYPFFYLALQRKAWYSWGHQINRIWGHIVFTLCFIPYRPEFRSRLAKGQSYVYCANHTSFIDIPTIYMSVPGTFSFIGKISLGKVPLFGYMYSRLHILVDRKSPASRVGSLQKASDLIDEGGSISIFPEGTIPKQNPMLIEFKEGAFRLAIEKQIPIVPVTIPNNWLILPDDGKYLPDIKPCKIIFHEPISTIGMTQENVKDLKEKTFNIISTELKKQLGDAYR
ncbi:MAG: 1-acyl-sn-glycerol-3-phosphate acyltransferase [Cytophagales bacterium]|nr:1-acyl-sn-glycerol-3-phosphate acyltransferase [Cytophagales bacterium]